MFQTVKTVSFVGIAALLGLGAACLPAGAQTEVRLAPGDTVLFSVISDPNLGRQTTLGPDGAIYLPFAGKIAAAGLTIDELREKIYASLNGRAYRAGIADGEDVWRQLQEDDLYLDIAQYRPVYVTGDVRAPGEVPFRPGMSVRQALANAGGVGRPLEDNSEWEILGLMADRGVLFARIETQNTEIRRLQADLEAVIARRSSAGEASAETAKSNLGGESPTALEELGRRWLEARADLRALTDSGNELVIDQMENRLDVLEDLQAASEESLSLEEAEFARAEQLAERGVVPTSSMADARRALLQSSTRALETAGEVLRLKLDIARLSEETKADLTNEHVELLEAIADSMADLRLLETQLRSLDARLAVLGAIPADAQEMVTEMEIFRAESGGATGERAFPDMVMAPGDVLEVTIVTSGTDLPAVMH